MILHVHSVSNLQPEWIVLGFEVDSDSDVRETSPGVFTVGKSWVDSSKLTAPTEGSTGLPLGLAASRQDT